jgi:hypothetical protein
VDERAAVDRARRIARPASASAQPVAVLLDVERHARRLAAADRQPGRGATRSSAIAGSILPISSG